MTTFHSMGTRILRLHANLLGYERDFTILARADAKHLAAACVTEASKKYADKQKDVATSVKSDESDALTKHVTAATACMTKITMAGVPGMPAMPKH